MLTITHNPSLATRTTLRLGGTAIAEVVLTEAVDCCRLEAALKEWGGQPVILGGGSNTLAADGTLPIVLIRPHFTHPARIVAEADKTVYVRVGAGVRLPRLIGQCAAWGLSGLEGLCGIPGAVGGAVAMNAGSFGTEIGPLLHSVRIFAPGRGIVDVDATYLRCAYRSLTIEGLNGVFLLIQVTFALTRKTRSGITQAMRHNFFKKKSTQPLTAQSAGCIFKNPAPDMPAGLLLDRAGFRGKKLGGMAFSALHANFLINEGTGSAAAAFELMGQAREAVLSRFSVHLVPEVRLLCPPF